MSRRRLQGPFCDDGKEAGKKLVNDFYQDDCTNVVKQTFESDVRNASKQQFTIQQGDNWKVKVEKECAQDAFDRELVKIDKHCSGDESAGQDCNWLGKNAAGLVVADICPPSTLMPTEGDDTFQSICRDVAISVCKGYIRDAAEACGGTIGSANQETQFMNKCEDQVNNLIGR